MRVPGAFARLPACRHGNRTWTQRESCGDDRAGDGDQRQGIAGKAGAAGGQCVATDIRGYRPRPGRPQRTVVPLFVPVCGRQDLSVELAHISNGRYVKVRFGCPTSRCARPAEPVERMLRGRPRRAPTAPSPRSAMLYSAVLMRRLYLITRDLHLYLGMFISPFVLMFSLSVILLVHNWVPAATPEAAVRTVTGLSLPAGRQLHRNRRRSANGGPETELSAAAPGHPRGGVSVGTVRPS